MPNLDPRRPARLDALLDAIVWRRPPADHDPGHGLDPALVATVRRLHALGAATPIGRTRQRVWTSAVRDADALPSTGHDGRTTPVRRRRSWPVTQVAVAAVLLLVAAVSWVAGNGGGDRGDEGRGPSPYGLAVAREDGALTALDPLTLDDLPAASLANPTSALDHRGAVVLPGDEVRHLVSADGTTAVRLLIGPGSIRIVVSDSPSGPSQAIWTLPFAALPMGLSENGDRLVLFGPLPKVVGLDEAGTAPDVVVLDTRSGATMPPVRSAERSPGRAILLTATDPAATRLYRIVETGGVDASSVRFAPVAAALLVTDLATGAEVARVPLNGFQAGVWRTGRTLANGTPLDASDTPGLAISRDGRHLAVVHPDAGAVTLVDAQTLTVERTVGIAPFSAGTPISTADDFTTEPDADPWAAELHRAATGVFAPDGRRLYVRGLETRLDAQGNGEALLSGLGTVDVATGTVSGALPNAEPYAMLVPSPDGRWVYLITTPIIPTGGSGVVTEPHVLRRLDAETLGVVAERAFNEPIEVVVVPAVDARSADGS